jgi:hypothetical protein
MPSSVLRLGVSRRHSLASAVLLGATTYVAAMSVFFLRHTTEALLVLGALLAAYAWRLEGGLHRLALASLLASATLLVRIPAAVSLPALAGYFAWCLDSRVRRGGCRRELAPAFLGLTVPAALVAATHVAITYYKWGRWLGTPVTDQKFTTPLYVSLYGYLFSPGCSVFAYSPLLLMLPWTLPRFWRTHRAECVTILAIAGSFLLVSSAYEGWTGLWSAPGPRYLFVATPLLMLPLGPWLDQRRGGRATAALFGLAAAGLLVQVALASVLWPRVIAEMDLARWAPAMNCVFIPQLSPIVGSLWLLREGYVDSWLWVLWRGRDDLAAEPQVALAVCAVWAALLALCVALLWRSLAAGVRTERSDPALRNG